MAYSCTIHRIEGERKADNKALFFIYQAINEVIFETIQIDNIAKQESNTLKTTNKGEEKVKMVRLQALRA